MSYHTRARRAWVWYHTVQVQYLVYSTRYFAISGIFNKIFCRGKNYFARLWSKADKRKKLICCSLSSLPIVSSSVLVSLNKPIGTSAQRCKLQPWRYYPRYSHLDIKEKSSRWIHPSLLFTQITRPHCSHKSSDHVDRDDMDRMVLSLVTYTGKCYPNYRAMPQCPCNALMPIPCNSCFLKIWFNVVEDFIKSNICLLGGGHLGLRPEQPPLPY